MEQSILPWLVVLFPLAGFFINAFMGARWTKSPRPIVDTSPLQATPPVDTYDMEEVERREADAAAAQAKLHQEIHLDKGGKKLVGGLATLAIVASFVVSVLLFFQVTGMQGEERRLFSTRFDWLSVPGFDLSFGLAVDPLSALMLLIITGIGALIHFYSIGYMDHDRGYARYFTYLNLFVFFMLLLVMGSSLPVLFVGWEGVGLASYLLIGFYHERRAATDAGKKAFIVNRIGDAALLVAMFLIFKHFGTLEFFGENGFVTRAAMGDWPVEYAGTGLAAVTFAVPLLMFLGAAGKSAQIPLYVWLPDAMEGPTPVSALIHAATMVTGGVYLVCRTHPLFLQSPEVMTIVAVVGLATAFLAATIALVQNDIKRVLAYSTVSQLGFMFLACGVGAFGVAMFHVTTHAFFKALLFLGSGSVIHAMGGEQDMRKMGGLGPKIKTTWMTMLIGTIAIAGIPPLAGFWSKDEILLNAYAPSSVGGLGSPLLWAAGFVVSGMTAFYMVRLMMKTFAGQPRFDSETAKHVHESPSTMTFPLLVLAFLSIVGGFLNAPVLGLHYFDDFLGSTVNWRETASKPLNENQLPVLALLGASALLAIVVAVITRALYAGKPNGELRTESAKQNDPIWRTLSNKWGVDEVYDRVLVNPGRRFSHSLWRFVDTRIVDGTVNGTGRTVAGLGQAFRRWQSGYVRNYALSMLLGVVVVVAGCLLGMRGILR